MLNMLFNNSTKVLRWKEFQCISNSIQTAVPIRYFRKPKWLPKPIAKSIGYRNVVLKLETFEEFQEMKKLLDGSKTYSKSLWLWQRQLLAKDKLNETSENQLEGEEIQLKRIVHENEEVNIRVKSIKDKELVEEWVQVVKELQGLEKYKESEDDQKLQAATEQVLADMEKLKTAINLEDLDEAIERAMSSEVDYNFAIDKAGNVIRGRNNINSFPTS